MVFVFSHAQLGARAGEEMIGQAATDEMKALMEEVNKLVTWHTLLVRTPMRPGVPETRLHPFAIKSDAVISHVRLNLFPDGGVARLRVHGIVHRDWSSVAPDR